MRMTPLDIQSHTFRRRRFKGIDSDEVNGFLRLAAEDYEALLRENEVQKERMRHLEDRVESLAAQEKLLQNTLLNAQAITDDLQRTAVKEAEVLIMEAEFQAEKILDTAHRRAARLREDIRELHGARTGLATSLRACTKMHLDMIDRLEDDPEDEPVEMGVRYLVGSAGGGTPRVE